MKAVATFAVALAASCFFAATGAVAAEPPRDPFAAFNAVEEDVVIGGEHRCKESPVACVNLDDVALRGIVSGVAAPRAMVETKSGRSVVLRVGDMLGKGRIKAIRKDGVVIERFYFSAANGTVRNDVTVTLR